MTIRDLVSEGLRLDADASPAPWSVDYDSDCDDYGQEYGPWPCALVGPATQVMQGKDEHRATEINDLRTADAELIVWMRNNITAVLAELRAYQLALRDMQRLLADFGISKPPPRLAALLEGTTDDHP